jgi:hypothetical protein
MATSIPADLTQPVQDGIRPDNGRDFDLYELYRYTNGGPIEVLSLPDGRLMVCNEEAKLCGLNENPRASALVGFRSAGEARAILAAYAARGESVIVVGELPEDDHAPADYIAGDVLVCAAHEID